ncbi:MAG: L,D-transpeptidase [Puniceicoccales bacterium]|nr:L,D-transpeptidase [Puniceicoccales bacterium]
METRRKELQQAAREDCLCVSLGEQKLWHFYAGRPVAHYAVSTSRAAPSCIPDSLGTPTGLHQIADRIGAGEAPGMVFKGRRPLGFVWQNAPEAMRAQNLITSRILWLDGLDPGKNRGPGCDTYARYIYIHGTNQEDKIGTPNSHGCVLLRNTDVIALFDAVPSGALVWIGA